MSDTETDDLRELKTDPQGILPPPSDPVRKLEGAPEWAQALFEELHASRADTQLILQNQELAKRQFRAFQAETRGHLSSHDLEIVELHKRDDALEGRVDDLQVRLDEHLGQDKPE